MLRKIRCGLAFLGYMALRDARAGADPFVARIDKLFKIGVG